MIFSLQVFKHLNQAATCGIILTLWVMGCKEKPAPEPLFVPNTGQIQILNGCGISGAAEVFRDFLAEEGFDIIEFGNASTWNHPHTLVVARTGEDKVAQSLARVLKTPNLLHLQDPDALVEATVIVGKDYEELVRKWQRQKQKR